MKLRSFLFVSITMILCAAFASMVKAAGEKSDAARQATEKPVTAVENATEKVDDFVPEQPKPKTRRIILPAPLLLAKGYENLGAKAAAGVQVFKSENQFQSALKSKRQIACLIAKYACMDLPENDAEFREVLRNHAGQLGADYLVITTIPADIKKHYVSPLEQAAFHFCAFAYKRIPAKIGVDLDPIAARAEGTLKITGFSPGSRAEQAGLRAGDVLKKVDGEVPVQNENYTRKAVRWKAGDKVKVDVERDGKPLAFEVELIAG